MGWPRRTIAFVPQVFASFVVVGVAWAAHGPNGVFGGDVSVSGDIAVIGVSNDDDHGYSSGSAYVFQFGVADLDGSGSVDSGDIVAVLARWGDAGGPEDLDGSGVVDFGDVIVVLTAWGPCE